MIPPVPVHRTTQRHFTEDVFLVNILCWRVRAECRLDFE
jgi:hypothetical protein